MKKILGALVALVMMLSMASFAYAQDVTITYWFWADNDAYAATMQEMIADFNATNGKGITVVGEQIPWDGGGYSNTVFTAAMGGGGPDVASWKLTATPSFVANDLLAPLDDYLKDWEGYNEIESTLWDVMRQVGGGEKVYVMPWNTQVLYVYYRPSMFAAAGLSAPTTYAEFLDACAKLTKDGVYGFGMRGAKGGQEPWGSFIYARGGNFTDLTSPQAVQGMQDFIDLFQKGYTPSTAPSDGFSQIIDNFKSGLTAMTVHHIGSYAGMVEAFGEDVGAFVFPGDVGQWTSMGDTENVMFASCANKEAAFEWLAYLATGKGQETWCKVTGNVPVAASIKALDEFQSNPFMKVSIEGAPFAGILPVLDTTTEWINSVWPNTVQQALLGEITAQECMETLQAELYK
ncbi:MAG: sugar ABC transporter substrate-binding protein [Clostridiales bacterium]|nr:sugar ABC transporter substrate-binding protein [Clostridiales bacterium]